MPVPVWGVRMSPPVAVEIPLTEVVHEFDGKRETGLLFFRLVCAAEVTTAVDQPPKSLVFRTFGAVVMQFLFVVDTFLL